MADYGIALANASGAVVIDSNYRNFSLRATGQGVLTKPSGNNTFTVACTVGESYEVSIEINYLMAFKVFASFPFFNFEWLCAACCTTALRSQQGVGVWPASGSLIQTTMFDWILFQEGNVVSPPSSDYGMIVYNAAGDVVWHSDDTWLKIWVYSGTQTRSVGNTVNITVEDADNHYFVVIDNARYHEWVLNGGGTPLTGTYSQGGYFRSLQKIDSTTIQLDVHVRWAWGYGSSYTTMDYWDDTYRVLEVST